MPELAAGLETMGASVLPFPVIEAKPVEDSQSMDKAILSLRKYDWIIFTSVYGVEFFMQRLNECGFGNQGMPKICAVGPATAAGLKKFGREATLLPKEYVGEGILKALIDYYGGIHHLAGLDILLPRAKVAREFLPEALSEVGAKVDVVACYQTVRSKIDPGTMEKLEEKRPDLLVFTSSSTINNLMDILGTGAGRRMLMETTVAVIGPITASTAAAFGKRADIIPRENTIVSLLEAIREYYGPQSAVGSRQSPV
jgi:uroporphyrinogen-III synthase